jgi:Spy/CpxP family protein refolding chaperone
MTSTRRKATFLLVATFLGGLLAGGGLMALERRSDDRPRGGRRADWYLGHLQKELDLTSSQRDSVRAVLDRYGPRMDSLMQEIRPRLDTLRGAMRTEIERFLDQRQRNDFDKMRQHFTRDRQAGGADARR